MKSVIVEEGRAEMTLGVLRTGLVKLYFKEVRDLLRDNAKLADDVVAWVNLKGECDIVLEQGKPKRRPQTAV